MPENTLPPVPESDEPIGPTQSPMQNSPDWSSAQLSPRLETATDLHNLLDKRSRQLGARIRMLEQQRRHLRSIEKQRDSTNDALAEALKFLSESSKVLKEALLEAGPSADLDRLFDLNCEALGSVDDVLAELMTNVQCWREAWDQYARTCERAKNLKAEMAAAEPLIDA